MNHSMWALRLHERGGPEQLAYEQALAKAIRAASRGDAPLQPSVARKILARMQTLPAAVPHEALPHGESLSGRELDILRLLGRGASNREIADSLTLSEGTVKNHISAILSKTQLHDRTQAALFAVRNGLAG